MAMANRDGEVMASVPGLAIRADVPLAQCETALAAFLAADKYSRTKTHEGRRIEEIDGGWRLLNYEKFRFKMSQEETREKVAERVRRHREKIRLQSVTVTESNRCNDIAEASQIRSEADQKKEDTEAASASPREIEYPGAFGQVWDLTGKRGVKAKAFKAWKTVGKPGYSDIQAPWAAYLASERPSAGFVQDLSTWLNGRGWQQEWSVAASKPAGNTKPAWQREREAQGQREAQASVRYHERQAQEKHTCGFHLYRGEDKRFILEECPRSCKQHGRDLDGNPIDVR